MAKVRDGDLDKLGLLYERYKRPLLGFFVGLVHDRELGEDLLQNTFMRILKYRHLFRARLQDEVSGEQRDGDFRTWMYHIARNVKNDHFRKNKLHAEPVEKWTDKIVHTDNRSTEMQHEEEQDLLKLALERLPEEKREVILLSKYQEKKYSEIGELLGCSEGAVKVKVFRALQELKAIYGQLEKTF